MKFITDPLYGSIALGDSPELNSLLTRLIDTPEFQRLRGIRQLGFSYLVFPGAEHSRFGHSIGTFRNAQAILDHLRNTGDELAGNEEQRLVILLAALLHDIGHGPFSHAFEDALANAIGDTQSRTRQRHEEWSSALIRGDDSKISAILSEHDSSLPGKVAAVVTSGGQGTHSYLGNIVSSQLDADRFDYLLRDSWAAGVKYGDFDLDWLISNLVPNPDENRLEVGPKAHQAVEAYLYARLHMYQVVYLHKTTRAAEQMLYKIFARARFLADNGDLVWDGIPPLLMKALSGTEPDPLTDANLYVQMNDASLTALLTRWAFDAKDEILRDLAHGLVTRQLYKSVDVSDVGVTELIDAYTAVSDVVTKSGYDPGWHLLRDEMSKTGFEVQYSEDPAEPTQNVYLIDRSGNSKIASDHLDGIRALKKEFIVQRFYVPESIVDKARKAAGVTA